MLAPVVQIPVELEKLFVVLEHALPDREQLERIARELTSDSPDDLPQGDDLQRVLDAAAGLTRYEAEGAFALSLTRHNAIRPEAIWELKAQTLQKNNLLTLHRGRASASTPWAAWPTSRTSAAGPCSRASRSSRAASCCWACPAPARVAFAKALGNETGRPTLLLDIGALHGQPGRAIGGEPPAGAADRRRHEPVRPVRGRAGEGAQRRRQPGRQRRLDPAVRHAADLAVRPRPGRLLRRHRPTTSASCRRSSPGPNASTASSSSTCPTRRRRTPSGRMYRQQFGIPEGQARPDDTVWTGAEIKSCCRLAALLDVPLTQAAQHVVPVAVTAAEQVERLRTWASGRCVCAQSRHLLA